MALRIYWTKNIFNKSLNSFYILYLRHKHLSQKSILITTDVLDEFTTQLLQKKTTKWDVAKERARSVKMKDCNLDVDCPIKLNVDKMNGIDLNATFQSALDDSNNKYLIVLIEECMKHKLSPSMVILTNLLSHFSRNGNCDVLNRIIELCEAVNPHLLITNSYFAHYIAEAISVNGDTNTAIDLFEKVYVENVFLRRKIRFMLIHIILEVVNNRSEAAIITLTKFTEMLFDKHKDIYPLAYMWETFFLSEWFAEQMRAIDILKKHHPDLLDFITQRIQFVITMSLKKQQIDPVLRLLAYLMENKFQPQYSIVIITMFDYSYKRGDLKTCMDIVNWSKKYEISLPNHFEDKYLDLILKQMKNESMKMIVEKSVNHFKF